MFVLYIPVVNQHELTRECLENLNKTVRERDDFVALVIDNGSDIPYDRTEFEGLDICVELIRNEENLSGYYTILQAQEWLEKNTQPDPRHLIGFMHNDVFVYEPGWDVRVKQSFAGDPLLSLVGFCGSNEVCDRGGRGGGTMCFFDGRRGQAQHHTGKRVTGLHAAAILDSLTMIFRASVVPTLGVDETIAPAHFYDKIWCMKLIDRGERVAVLGVQIDHLGGQTSVGVPQVTQAAVKWCDRYGIGYKKDEPATAAQAVYLEAERRMFAEFAPKGIIPSYVDDNYQLRRNTGQPTWPAPSPWK